MMQALSFSRTASNARHAGLTRLFVLSRRAYLTALALALPFMAPGALAQKPDILIGQTAPLSGLMASTMSGVLMGEQLAIDEVNAKGGIQGRKVKLLVLDDGFDPKRSLENAQELVENQGVVALFGTVGTAQTAAVLPYIVEKRIPLIAAYSGSPALRAQPNPYFFTTQASYADELVKMVRNLKSVQTSRIAVVYQSNEFGKLLLPLAEKVVGAEGLVIVGSRPMDPAGADAIAVAQSLATAKPQAIILIAAGPAVVSYVKANRAALGVPVYTFSLSASNSILKALGEDARGLAVARSTPYPWRATTPLARNFKALLDKKDKPVDYDGFLGYINARVMLEGVRTAGKKITPDNITQAMETLNRLDLGGYTLSYSPQNHHGSNFVEITVVGPNGDTLS